MRKILLLVALAASFMAVAQNDPFATPEGEMKQYIMSGEFDVYEMAYMEGMVARAVFSEDGKTVWLGGLYPYFENPWIKTTRQGNILSVDMDQVIAFNYYDMYDVNAHPIITTDVYGRVTREGVYRFIIDGDRIYAEDMDCYLTLCSVDDDHFFYSTTGKYDMKEYNNQPVQVPEGVEYASYVLTYDDGWGGNPKMLTQLGFKGNDVYTNALTNEMAGSVVKGTIANDGSLVFPSGQYLGMGTESYRFFNALSILDYDESTWTYTYGTPENYKLVPDGNGGFMAEDKVLACVTSINPRSYAYAYNKLSLTPYAGDAPARPADPNNVYVNDMIEWLGYNSVSFALPFEDEFGQFINQNNLYFRLYKDGELYDYSGEAYDGDRANFLEDNTLVPATYLSDNFSVFNGSWTVRFYETDWQEWGVQAVYIVDGERHVSNIVHANRDYESWTEIVDDNTGIVELATDANRSATAIYNLQGQKVDTMVKGQIYIVNGKKVLVK